MALTISDIAEFNYNGNPILVNFESDQTAANSVFQFSNPYGIPTIGSVIKLYFDNEEVIITYNFATFTDFYNYLNQHFVIKRYFSVVQAGVNITLTSFNKESLNLSAVTDADFTPAVLTITEGGIAAVDVLLGVNIWDGTDFIPSNFDKAHKVQLDSFAYFNIAEAFVFDAIDIPHDALTGFNPFVMDTIKYELEFAERTVSALSQVTKTNIDLFSINGKVNQNYIGSAITSKYLLTAARRSAFNKDDEPRFASFLVTEDFTNVKLKITAYDFNDVTYLIEKTLDNCTKGDIVNIPISYNSLGLNASEDGPFHKYKVFVEYDLTDTTYQTETFSVECNRHLDLNYATFLYLNSRGGIDTVSFIGETEETTSFERLEYQRQTTTGLKEVRTEQHRIQQSFKQFTGFYDDWREWNTIEEFYNSEEIFWWKDGQLKKVIINTSNFDKESKTDDLFESDFEFLLSTDDVSPNLNFAEFVTLEIPSIELRSPTAIGYHVDAVPE